MNKNFYVDPNSYDFRLICDSLIHRTFVHVDEICNGLQLPRPARGSGGKIENEVGTIEWIHQDDPIENSSLRISSHGSTVVVLFAGTVGDPCNVSIVPSIPYFADGGLQAFISIEEKISEITDCSFAIISDKASLEFTKDVEDIDNDI